MSNDKRLKNSFILIIEFDEQEWLWIKYLSSL